VLATSGYAAGRLHGQLSYRVGYRYGYRQGYFDGDRASWNRRRRELQAAVASVLKALQTGRVDAYQPMVGTTYTSGSREVGEGLVRLASPTGTGAPIGPARAGHP
jgi:hypothetical protein